MREAVSDKSTIHFRKVATHHGAAQKNKAANRPPYPKQIQTQRLKADPDAAAVIAATFMIVAIMPVAAIPPLVEIPVIRVIVEVHARRSNPALGMPAVALVVARQIGGCRSGSNHQSACHHKRGNSGGR